MSRIARPSPYSLPARSIEHCSGDREGESLPTVAIDPRSSGNSTDLLDRSLRTVVLGADQEDDAVYESERVSEHQLLHFTIVLPAPEAPRKKLPSNFDFALLTVVAMVARPADDLAVPRVRGDQRATGSHRLVEEGAEHLWLITIPCRMLLPDKWISRDSEQRIEVVSAKRAEVQELAAQNRLTIGSGRALHCGSSPRPEVTICDQPSSDQSSSSSIR